MYKAKPIFSSQVNGMTDECFYMLSLILVINHIPAMTIFWPGALFRLFQTFTLKAWMFLIQALFQQFIKDEMVYIPVRVSWFLITWKLLYTGYENLFTGTPTKTSDVFLLRLTVFFIFFCSWISTLHQFPSAPICLCLSPLSHNYVNKQWERNDQGVTLREA